jgi:predicted phosphodiesterase
MRLALLSDVHGNPIALDAVLADVQDQGGADAYWVLGDLAAIGYDPIGALERLAALPQVRFARGNTDRYVVSGERPKPDLAQSALGDLDLVRLLVMIAGSFAWTQGAVTATGWFPWLAGLPLEQRMTLPDGTRLLGVHASPGQDDGDGISPATSDDTLRGLLAGCDANLVCVGHTHRALDRTVDGVRVVNLGSVSNPHGSDLRASYVLLDAGAGGYGLRHRQVSYDVQAVVEAVKRSHHPAADFIIGHFLGQRRPSWEQA